MKTTFVLFIFSIGNILGANQLVAQEKVVPVASFEKVIISPHIQVTFKQGDTESVTIENAKVSSDKINPLCILI